MYKLIQIINNQKIDDLILTIWNKNHIDIEASAIKRNKGFFDITYYKLGYSSTDRISFAEALRLLENDYLKSKGSYCETLERIYNKERIIDEFFEKCSKNDGLLQALTMKQNLKQG